MNNHLITNEKNQVKQVIIRGSNTGIYQATYMSESSSACPRMSILRNADIKLPYDAKTRVVFSIGAIFEDWFGENEFKDGVEFEKEKEVLIKTATMDFGCHIDYFANGKCYELKSLTSSNTYKKVFHPKKPKPKWQNVVQLLTYMTALEVNESYLIYGSYCHITNYSTLKQGDDELVRLATPELKRFTITCDDNGDVYLDGERYYNLNKADIVAFWQKYTSDINDNYLPNIPTNENGKNNCCFFCNFKGVCHLGNPQTIEEFTKKCADYVAYKLSILEKEEISVDTPD